MTAIRKGRAAVAARLLVLAMTTSALSLPPGAASAQQTFTPREEEPEEFPDAPGREETFYFCTACHNFKLVAQQGMSRPRWDGTLDFMTERHGMPKLEGKDRDVILDYLEQAFPETTATPGWQNPFLKR
ncbi:MAG: hypothetical protein IT539_17050 [Bradyrhizobiaceae bacterium]|nr:hypothetical protein [Bradyrhizobiaceae bacterium]